MNTFFLAANLANYAAEFLLFLAASVAAWRWGGPAARAGALVNLAAWLLTTPANFLPIGETQQMYLVCALDLLAAAGFLFVAARYNSLWIATAVLAEGVQTCVDVVYVGEGSSLDRIHHFLVGATDSAFTWAIQIAILGAALADRRRLASGASVRV